MRNLITFKSMTTLWVANVAFFMCSFLIQNIVESDSLHGKSMNESFNIVCAIETLKQKNKNSVDCLFSLFASSASFSKKLELSNNPKIVFLSHTHIKSLFFSKNSNYIHRFTKSNSSRAPPITFS